MGPQRDGGQKEIPETGGHPKQKTKKQNAGQNGMVELWW